MNPILAAVALVVVAGTVVAVAARPPRVAILGLAIVLIGSPVLADPLPAPLGLASRFVGAILAATCSGSRRATAGESAGQAHLPAGRISAGRPRP